jgi:pilus assembly protein Flp/PilA
MNLHGSGSCKGKKIRVKYRSNFIFLERRKKPMLFSLKERGQGMVEYALILVLVAVVVIAALTIMGPVIGNIFSTINSKL